MHVMVDLETMGNRPNAPIVAIGAVSFDKNGVVDGFYETTPLQEAIDAGAVMDPDTVLWWLKQDEAARMELTKPASSSLSAALDRFAVFVADFGTDGVWGNGASFDNVILHETYRRMGRQSPWPFWKDRCYRTVKNMFPEIEMKREGTHHNALDDAKSQAIHLLEIDDTWGFL